MMLHILLLVPFVVGVTGRVIPNLELEKVMDDVLLRSLADIPGRRSLPSHDYDFSYDLFGMPCNLKLKASDPVLIGPSNITRSGKLFGSELPYSSSTNGEALVLGKLNFGTLEVIYPQLEVDILGLTYNGSASMSILDATAHITLNAYHDALVKCYAVVQLSEFDGEFVMNLGDSPLQKMLFALAEHYINRFVYPYQLLQYFLFPNVTLSLTKAIETAFKNLAC